MLRTALPPFTVFTREVVANRAASLSGALVAASICLPAAEAAAQGVVLTGDAVRETVVGKTVDLDTPLGTKITINYKDNGTMSGTAGAALALYLGASSDRGRWWVDNGRLCQKFFKWLEGETSCLRLRLNGTHIAWSRDDGKTGTATIVGGPTRHQPTYALGGAGLASGLAATPPHQPPATRETPAEARHDTAERSLPAPRIAATSPPRPILASLTPAVAHVPRPEPIVHPPAPSMAFHLPADWNAEEVEATNLKAMVADTRKAHAVHRWCQEVKDIRLLTRPQAVDAEAPELMTAARQLQAPDYSTVPTASCLVPSPAMVDVARQMADSP